MYTTKWNYPLYVIAIIISYFNMDTGGIILTGGGIENR
jgi:hypothetical protein